MSAIPVNAVSQADLEAWYSMKQELDTLKAKEILLRNKIFGGLFPDPKEGTNKHNLSDGWVLKATHVINRSVDEAALAVHREEFAEKQISVEQLIRYKPELKTAEYRKLEGEKLALFDSVLIIKPGTPSLEIVLPKRQS